MSRSPRGDRQTEPSERLEGTPDVSPAVLASAREVLLVEILPRLQAAQGISEAICRGDVDAAAIVQLQVLFEWTREWTGIAHRLADQ